MSHPGAETRHRKSDRLQRGRRVAELPVRWNPRMTLPIAVYAFTVWLSMHTLNQTSYRGFGFVMLTWFGLKLFLAVLPTSVRAPRRPPALRFGAVVTSYNEDPDLIRECLDSLYLQTYRPVKIVFNDDCSRSRKGVKAVQQWAAEHPDMPVTIHRQSVNRGKRHGLAYGFREMPSSDVDVYICVDSDTFLAPGSLAAACLTFNDRRVIAATGACLASNAKRNALTLVENLRYANAFFGERAALSRVGSVLCVSGAVAFWRATVIEAVLEDFMTQTVFGKEVNSGDDRHLTNLVLPYGHVKFIPEAVAYTDVPEHLKQYSKQQVRWGRSFWLESLWLLATLRFDKAYWWLCLGDLFFGAAAAVNLLWLAADFAFTGQFHFAQYAWLSFIWAYARSAYILTAPKTVISPMMALGSFALSSLNTLLSTFLVTPLRIFSAATIHEVGWMTRHNQGPDTGAVPLKLVRAASESATEEGVA
jgi:hyaluronan synthase